MKNYSKGSKGLFVPQNNILHLHNKFNFTIFNVVDSLKVVTPFMQVINYMTKNFATLGSLWLQPPFCLKYLSKKLLHFVVL